MRLLSIHIRLRMSQTHRDMAERQGFQDPPDAALAHAHEQAVHQPLPQIRQPPADQAVLRVGALADPLRQLLFLRLLQLGRPSAAMLIGQTVDASLVVADHPVAQDLAIHPAGPRRFRPRPAIEYQRDRQRPSCHFRIRAGRRG